MAELKKYLYILQKAEFYIALVLMSGAVLIFLPSTSGRDLNIVRELEVLQPNNGAQFDSSWFDSECKVIVFLKGNLPGFTLNHWMSYIQKYSSVSFLFYYYGNDQEMLKERMEKADFQHPILIDPQGIFYKKNKDLVKDYTFMSFVVSGESMEMSNPTIPNFGRLLKSCQ